MKTKLIFPFLLAAALVSGCQSNKYAGARPTGVPHVIADQPVHFPNDPLEYTLVRDGDRLSMRINNPTSDRVVLLGNRAYVVDPQEKSHPLRSMVIPAHSTARLLLPPEPVKATGHGWTGPGWGGGPGWGWGPYPPGDAYFHDFYPPPPYYTASPSPYDWNWSNNGLARVHLAFERDRQPFGQDFEIVREPGKH
jgi:hypothetical protein